jgi:carboxyl-terminal processing protease
VQNLIDLDQYARDPSVHFGQLKLTVAQFFRINGGSTQHRGVVPDIAYPQTAWGSEDFGESSLDFALPYTEVKAADFVRSGDLSALKPLLETRHETRIAKDQEFKWWFDDLAEYQKQRERKDMSLLECSRAARSERAEARRAQARGTHVPASIRRGRKASMAMMVCWPTSVATTRLRQTRRMRSRSPISCCAKAPTFSPMRSICSAPTSVSRRR